MDELIRIEDLYVNYVTDEEVVYAVNGVNLTMKKGETLGLVGETGAGKSTTALAILRLLQKNIGNVNGGRINFDGKDLLAVSEEEMRKVRGDRISMIFQDPMTSLNPNIRIGDQIGEVLEVHRPELNKREISDRVDGILQMVGIPPSRKGEYPHQFSGGMKQRVVIAIALTCEPDLLIADEPTTALDVTIQAQVLNMMNDLKQELGTSMLLITHDLGVVAAMCDTVAVMYAGEIIESGTVEDIYEGERHHPYTVGLFGSIPDLTVAAKRLSPISGLMPDPTDLPAGCKFHPRCPRCMDICKVEQPRICQVGTQNIRCHLYTATSYHEENPNE